MAATPKSARELISDSLGAQKDRQGITSDWNSLQEPIDGVRIKEMKNVVKGSGDVLCEVFRRDWMLDDGQVDQVFQSVMNPGSISAWHVHYLSSDRLFAGVGLLQIVLFDARENSPTQGRINEFRVGAARPTLVVIPPGVFHGVRNISTEPAVLLNLVTRAYQYEDPDHWRLPLDTDKIPYRFGPLRTW
jgi:dTDP-4-dehydrorhamnose 3,5-epimerase